MRKLKLLLLLCFGAIGLNAQVGASCSNAQTISYGTSTITSTHATHWMKINPTSADVRVALFPDTLQVEYDTLLAYAGSCGNQTVLSSAGNLDGNRVMWFDLHGLTPGQSYYLKTERSSDSTNASRFFVLIEQIAVSCNDLMVNGGFESYSGYPVCSNQLSTFNISLANGWQDASLITPSPSADFYHVNAPSNVSCLNFPPTPNTGNGHVGFAVGGANNANYLEYCVSPQSQSLLAGTTYAVTYFVKRATGNDPVTISVKVSYTLAQAQGWTGVVLTPQIAIPQPNGYTKMVCYYQPLISGPIYLTIGSSTPPLNPTLNYFYLDDVSIYESIGVSSAAQTICTSIYPTTFQAFGGSGYTWSITPASTNFSSNGNTASFIPSTTGNYTVTVTGTTLGGCPSTAVYPFQVIPSPTASISPSGIVTICSGNATTLTANTNYPAGIQWYTAVNIQGQGLQTLNCAGCTTISVTQPGFYVLQVTGANGCMTFSVVQVVQNISPTLTLLSTSEHCTASNDGTGTAQVSSGTPPYTYSWSTQPIQTTSTATGLDAGTYTVTVTDANGCTVSGTVTIGTDPLPPAPAITASYGNAPNLCTSGQVVVYTVSNYNAALTYVPTFNPTPASVSQPFAGVWTVDWGSICNDIDFTLTSYNGNAVCSSTTTISLPGCCGMCNFTGNDAMSNGTSISTVPQLAAAYPAFFTITGNTYTYNNPAGTLYVNGNLTIAGGIIFQIVNSDVQLGTNAALLLTSATTNQIQIIGSHLHASCGDMWKGIIASGTNNNIDINSNSLIEDAIYAVSSSLGAPFKLDESIFNKNYQSVVASFYNAAHPGQVKNCVFTCRQLPIGTTINDVKGAQVVTFVQVFPVENYPTATLLPPYANKRSFAGAYIDRVGAAQLNASNQLINVTDISIGVLGGYNELNVFDNLDFGVYASKSNVQVFNNAFQFITSYTNVKGNPGTPGTAIFGTTDGLNTNKRFWVGNPQTNSNTFYDCGRGIELNGYYDVSIRGNNFESTIAYSSLAVFSPIGNMAVYVKSGRYILADIMENHIVNWDLGIYFINDVYALSTTTYMKFMGDANIKFNTIEPVLYNGAPNTEYVRNAIVTQSLYPSNCPSCIVNYNAQPGRLYIDGNDMYNVFNGITKQGWIHMPRCADNQINLVMQPVGQFTIPAQQGIRVIDCEEPIENNNVIVGPNDSKKTLRGIYLTNNNAPHVRCNDVDQVGQCIVYEASNMNGSFWNNAMRTSQDGFSLLNNGKISTQGAPMLAINNFTGVTGDNLFYGPFSHADTYTENTLTPQNHSKLYVRPGYPYQPAVNATNGIPASDDYFLNQSLFVVPGTTPYSCNTPAPIPPAGGGDQTGEAHVLANIASEQTEETGFVQETRWQDQQRTYELLKQDAALMDTSLVLQNFYVEMQNSPTEKIAVVEEQMAKDSLSSALATNAALVPNCLIEQNYKDFNVLYLKATAGDSLSLADIAALEALAGQCPLIGGRAVYRARILVCLIDGVYRTWEDTCAIPPSTARRNLTPQTASPQSNQAQVVSLYPNPNNGTMTLAYSLDEDATLSIVNALGQVVATQTIYAGQNKNMILVENLPNGIYAVNLNANGKIIYREVVQIVK